jgi:hypothetical protein
MHIVHFVELPLLSWPWCLSAWLLFMLVSKDMLCFYINILHPREIAHCNQMLLLILAGGFGVLNSLTVIKNQYDISKGEGKYNLLLSCWLS